jgi:hypothetical protein
MNACYVEGDEYRGDLRKKDGKNQAKISPF